MCVRESEYTTVTSTSKMYIHTCKNAEQHSTVSNDKLAHLFSMPGLVVSVTQGALENLNG